MVWIDLSERAAHHHMSPGFRPFSYASVDGGLWVGQLFFERPNAPLVRGQRRGSDGDVVKCTLSYTLATKFALSHPRNEGHDDRAR